MVLCLTFLAGITALDNMRSQTKSAMQAAAFEIEAMNIEARLQYLMATTPFGPNTLRLGQISTGGTITAQSAASSTTPVLIDDTGYVWRSGDPQIPYRLSLQDEAGLVNVDRTSQDVLTRLFREIGVSESGADTLSGEVLTYNMQPAPALPMRRAAQVLALDGADGLINAPARAKLEDLATAEPDSNIANINTAPAEVLKVWFGFSDKQAQQAVSDRMTNTFTQLAQIGAVGTGAAAAYVFPSGRLRLTLSDPATGLRYRSVLMLTPRDQERPIWIDNPRVQQSRPEASPSLDALQPFPDVPGVTDRR